MSEATTHHRLEGLEPDNLLAFLALLGLLRCLDAADRSQSESLKLRPRVFWETAPLRPVLRVIHPVQRSELLQSTAKGISILSAVHDFGGRSDLDYSQSEAREELMKAAEAATPTHRDRADLLAALMNDAAVRQDKKNKQLKIEPTPFCLQFGQANQHFLERLEKVPTEISAVPRKQKTNYVRNAEQSIARALFERWERAAPMSSSFRWDPEEARRYALMAGNPTENEYKGGTEEGANRLAAIGIASLTLSPSSQHRALRASVLGGMSIGQEFSFRWPIWREPATLSAIRALLGHPNLFDGRGLGHLGVERIMITTRISVARLMNFTWSRVSRMET